MIVVVVTIDGGLGCCFLVIFIFLLPSCTTSLCVVCGCNFNTNPPFVYTIIYIKIDKRVYSMSKLELMQMGFPGGIAEVMLHLHDRIAASDVAPEEVPIPVMHTFLVKELDESPDGELFVKGTFIQTQIGQTDEHFEFRFNDASATEDNLHMRRKTHIPDFGIRTTYNVVLPTKRTQIFSAFPFQIYQISCLVELSTLAVIRDSGEYELRPDIRLWSQDERQLLVIRGVEELNSTENYALVTGSPKVCNGGGQTKNVFFFSLFFFFTV